MRHVSKYFPGVAFALSLIGCDIEAERAASDVVGSDTAFADDIQHGSTTFELDDPGELEYFIEETMSPSFASSARSVLENGISDGEVTRYGYCVHGCGGDGIYLTLTCTERECYFEPYEEPDVPCC
jgi:hypothetical protein